MSATNRGAVRNEFDFYATPKEPIEKILAEVDCKKDYAEIREDKDYFDSRVMSDLIITNPPFNIALDFLQKSLKESKTVVYLLRLNFLGSQKRKEFWQSNPPTHLFTLAKRPSFTGKGTDATEYAWFVWDGGGGILKDLMEFMFCKKPNSIK
jgi:hypothetical protein